MANFRPAHSNTKARNGEAMEGAAGRSVGMGGQGNANRDRVRADWLRGGRGDWPRPETQVKP